MEYRCRDLASQLHLSVEELMNVANEQDIQIRNQFSFLSEETCVLLIQKVNAIQARQFTSHSESQNQQTEEGENKMAKASRKQKNVNLQRKVLAGAMVLGTVGSMALTTGVSIANAESIDHAPKAEEVSKTTKISEKYSFIARWNNQTKIETFGSGWHKTTKTDDSKDTLDAWTLLNPSDSQKGKVGVIYKNVGKYKGQNVNLKITVLDWDPFYKKNRMISYSINNIAHEQSGYNSVKQKWEYVDDSGKPMNIPGTYMTFNDIDRYQSVQFDKATSNEIAKILYDKGSILQYFDHNGEIEIKAHDNELHDNDDKRTMFTALFNGSSMTFSWQRDYKAAGDNPNRVLDPSWGGGEYFGYMGKKLAPTEIIAPTKKVSDNDEKNKDSNKLDTVQENFSYSVYQEIPDEWKEFYYKDLTISDTLVPELELNGKVKVVDEGNKDRTSFFKDNSKGNELRFDATDSALKNPEFYGHTYQLQVPVKVKAGSNLDKYKDKSGNIVLPNTAKVKINNDSRNSNQVTTTVPKLTPEKVTKCLVDNGKAVDSETLTKSDPVGTYRIDNVIPNDTIHSSIVLDDDLDDHLALVDGDKSVKVIVSDPSDNDVKVGKGSEVSGSNTKGSDTSSTSSDTQSDAKKDDKTTTSTTASSSDHKASTSADYDSALKAAQSVVDKYKDAKEGTVDHVILSDAQMTVNAIEGLKKGNNIAVGKNIDIIQNAMNASGESNKPNATQKADFQKLIDILNGVSKGTNVTASSSSASKEKETVSSKDSSSKDQSNDKATANEASDAEIKADASKELTGDAVPKGKDITAEGKLEVKDGNHIQWTAKDPKALVGKKVSMIVQVKLKDGTKVSDIKDGRIPNTAKLTIDGKSTPSNTVYLGVDKAPVVPKKETPKSSSKESIPGQAKPKYLPQTGTDAMKEVGIGIAGLGLGGILGFLFGKKKK